MSPHRFTIEFQDDDGNRRRSVYLSDAEGARWFRREDRYESDQWIRQRYEQIGPPTLEAKPIGSSRVITGP